MKISSKTKGSFHSIPQDTTSIVKLLGYEPDPNWLESIIK